MFSFGPCSSRTRARAVWSLADYSATNHHHERWAKICQLKLLYLSLYVFVCIFIFLDPAYCISYSDPFCHLFLKNISHHRCLRFSLYLSVSLSLSLFLSLYLYSRLNLNSWHHQLSENIRFEGYLRPDSSVNAHLWTQEKLARTGGRVEKSKVLQEVLADLKITNLIDTTYNKAFDIFWVYPPE